jgi:hypothetical protein
MFQASQAHLQGVYSCIKQFNFFIISSTVNRFKPTACTNPSTMNHTLTNLQQFCYVLEMIKRLNDCFMLLCTAWWWAETCSSWCIKTLLWFWWSVHSLFYKVCTQIIKLMSDCDFGLTKKRKCICFVRNTGAVHAPRGCYVIALQTVMDSLFVLKVLKGE